MLASETRAGVVDVNELDHPIEQEAQQPIDEQVSVHRERMSLLTFCLLAIWTTLADVTIYRAHGFAGPAVFFLLVPVVFAIRNTQSSRGTGERSPLALRVARSVCIGLLCIAACRLVLLGSVWVFLAAVVLTFGLALASARSFPWALESASLTLLSWIDGLLWLASHRLPVFRGQSEQQAMDVSRTLRWVLPLSAMLVFGAIFVFANPDLVDFASRKIQWTADQVFDWLRRLGTWELPFCIFVLLVGAGLLFPKLGKRRIGGEDGPVSVSSPTPAPLYEAYRNTLVGLIVLFVVYLVYEFIHLWMRDFPPGFYYAGYAHQGPRG